MNTQHPDLKQIPQETPPTAPQESPASIDYTHFSLNVSREANKISNLNSKMQTPGSAVSQSDPPHHEQSAEEHVTMETPREQQNSDVVSPPRQPEAAVPGALQQPKPQQSDTQLTDASHLIPGQAMTNQSRGQLNPSPLSQTSQGVQPDVSTVVGEAEKVFSESAAVFKNDIPSPYTQQTEIKPQSTAPVAAGPPSEPVVQPEIKKEESKPAPAEKTHETIANDLIHFKDMSKLVEFMHTKKKFKTLLEKVVTYHEKHLKTKHGSSK